MNPDGYDYTFTATTPGRRLWRKNLRDVNGDGLIDPQHDGVDTEPQLAREVELGPRGRLGRPVGETYHGTGPASEPEVQASRSLHQRLRPRFLIDYHSVAQLILYPEGWQVETEATDTPLMEALAGDDDHPAVAGFDPDVSAELYTTNGDVTGDAWGNWAPRPTPSSSTAAPARRRRHRRRARLARPAASSSRTTRPTSRPSSQKNLGFALDLAKSAKRPGRAGRRTSATRRRTSCRRRSRSRYGDPQTVEVNAKRSLGNVRVYWQVNGGARAARPTVASTRAASATASPGTYYHQPPRHRSSGAKPGDKVKVWFGRGDSRLGAVHLHGQAGHRQQGAADGGRGLHGPQRRPADADAPARSTWTPTRRR